jgi:hypothetical protein
MGSYGQLPYSEIIGLGGQIGQNFGRGYQRRRVDSALESFNGDYNAAANKLMQMGMVDEAVKLYSMAAMSDYRTGMLGVANQKAQPSLEDQILQQYLTPQGPSRLSPPDTESAADAAEEAEASGVPGTAYTRPSLDGAPAFVQEKLGTTQDKARWKQEGEGAGNRNSFRTALQEQGPEVDSLIGELTDLIRTSDEGTFRNALGPQQGTPDPDDWRETLSRGLPQALGGISNYLEKGAEHGFLNPNGDFRQPSELPGGFTTTLRSQVLASQAAITNVMQRLLRVPGIGAQSDAELKQIILQTGELSKAETKQEFHTRLKGLMGRLKALGFNVKIPSLDQVEGPSNSKTADRYSNPSEAPADPMTGSMAPTVNENTMVGGENIGRTTSQPPTPPKRALNALKAYAKNPEARAAFDEIYGPGAAEFYLQKYR